MSDEMLKTTGKLLINVKPSYTITMHHGTGEVSKLDFNGSKLVFTGDAEESAKVFVNYLTMIWEKRLQEEREAEREACAKECEDLRKFFAGSDFAVDREEHYVPGNSLAYTQCAAAIRARGET